MWTIRHKEKISSRNCQKSPLLPTGFHKIESLKKYHRGRRKIFNGPILTSPFMYTRQQWPLNENGQSNEKFIHSGRRVEFKATIPKPKKQKQHLSLENRFGNDIFSVACASDY
jgi:hypothetical protein